MQEAGRWLWDVRVPMRDGVELSVDLHLPEAGLSGGPYPVVLVRTAAGNQAAALVKRARVLADAGFAVALQDVRGREDSAGCFRPYADEGRDGHDTVEHLAAQEWCTGKVGMMGAGYAGWTQWAAAAQRPPHLVTLVSTSAWSPAHSAAPGAQPLADVAWMHAMSARVWQEAGQVDWESVLREPLSAMESALGCRLPDWPVPALQLTPSDFAGIEQPVLHLTGWHDTAQTSALAFYGGMRAHSPAAADQALVVGPWDAAGAWTPTQVLGGVDFGADAATDLDDLHVRWFTHWLKETGERPTPRVFVTGAREWRDGEWTEGDPVTWFLHGGGVLSAEAPSDDAPAGFRYDPADPVQLTADLTFFPSAPRSPAQLPLDRRFVERRPDVLVWTSAPQPDALELSGRPFVRLSVSSEPAGADWFVQLTDVAPGGASIVLATGGVRDAGATAVHDVDVELSGLAHVVQPGHRLRLSVTGSWFPLFDRNPVAVTSTVHHGAAHPSRLVLPVRSADR